MSHLNDLPVKLRGVKHYFYLIGAFQNKLEIFKHHIQTEFNHFPRLLKQNRGKKDTTYVQFIEMITNFTYDLATFLFENNSCGFLE